MKNLIKLLLFLCVAAAGAKGAVTEFYCVTTGSNLNAGSTTADAAVYTSPANGGWNSGTGVFTPVSGTPNATVAVGDFASIYLDAAAVTAFVSRVTAVSSTTITVSTTAISGTLPTTGGTGFTCKTGGAWKGPNAASGFPFNFVVGTLTNATGNPPRVNFKSGTNYGITAAMTHTLAGPTVFQGYTTTVGDGGQAVIDGGDPGASYIMLAVSTGASLVFRDLIFQKNGSTGTGTADGVTNSSAGTVFDRCVFNTMRGSGLSTTAAGTILQSEAYLCNVSNTASAGGFKATGTGALFVRTISHDNAGNVNNGYVNVGQNYYIDAIADTNGLNGFLTTGAADRSVFEGCVAYGSTAGAGIMTNAAANQQIIAENCILLSNATYGINANSTSGTVMLRNNAYFNNTTNQTTGGAAVPFDDVGGITLASDPFVAAATGDFRVSLPAAKGSGYGNFTETQASYTGTLGYPDVGAAQHLETTSAIPSLGSP